MRNYSEFLPEGIEIRIRNENLTQFIMPVYHNDGDMVDLYVDETLSTEDSFYITDLGKTHMKISFTREDDTLEERAKELGISFVQGELCLTCKPVYLYPSLMLLAMFSRESVSPVGLAA